MGIAHGLYDLSSIINDSDLAREIVDRRFVIANDGVAFDCFLLI